MSPQELFAAYPRVTHAVAYVELFICEVADDETLSGWDAMVGAKMSPDEIVQTLKGCCDETIADGSQGKHREALAEMDHPQFVTYIRGKLGMV